MKYLTVVLLLGICSGQLCGQGNDFNNLPYRPWKSFQGDSVAYLVYNYGNGNAGNEARKKSFKGLKVSDLFDELELPVTYIVGGMRRDGGEGRSGAIGFQLGIRQTGVLPSPIIDLYLEIRFTETLSHEVISQLDFSSSKKWTSQAYEALKDVELSEVYFSPMYPPKGREDIIRKAKEWQKRELERRRAEGKK